MKLLGFYSLARGKSTCRSLLLAAMVVPGIALPAPDAGMPGGSPVAAATSPREAALARFDAARLGMFIHWGVWGKHHAAWAMYNKKIPLETYQEEARAVDASGFDAKAIVRLAVDSGMRYITFVAKHHDGFCLWDSKQTDWDIASTPYG